MKDYTNGVAIVVRQQRKTGNWFARCPECNRMVGAFTQAGLMTTICGHMNRDHYIPPRGNA